VVAAGALLYWIGKSQILELNQNDYLSLVMFSFLLCFIGGFIVFYGTRPFRKAMFPLLFLIFIVPIPTPILEPLIRILLIGSANTSYAIFNFLDVPVYRDGFIFELTGITVEVAKQCSGIRSTLALFITSVIAGHLFLRTGRRRIILSLCIFPITIFKNSLRIVTITLLASYVDPSWITNSWLHKAGGKPFFILALLFLAPVLWFLLRGEKTHASSDVSLPACPAPSGAALETERAESNLGDS
jgi:exosortase